MHPGVVRDAGEIRQCIGIIQHALADHLGQQAGQPRICREQPATEGDTVGLVDDAIRDTIWCSSRNTVWRISSVCSSDTPLTLCEPRKASELMRTRRPALSSISDSAASGGPSRVGSAQTASRCSAVDLIDDLHMARQQPLHQRDRPALQRLGQQRVIGIGDRVGGDAPRLVPGDLVQIDQDAHQLGDGDGGMRVVQLDRRLVGQRADVAVLADVPPHQILQRSGGEEVLLPQPQFLPGRRVVAWIQHLRDRVRARARLQCADMIAAIECIEPQRIGGPRRPQSQRIGEVAAPADHRRVIGDRGHRFGGMPDEAGLAVRFGLRLDGAAEADRMA